MVDRNEMLERLERSTASLLHTVGQGGEADLLWKRGELIWSVLECLEHVAITEIGILRVLSRPPAAGEADLEGAEQIGKARIDDALHDRSQRYTAPESAAPRGRYATAEAALASLTGNRSRMKEMILEGRIRFDAGKQQHPLLGEMTKTDWFHFLLAHSERHRMQIEEILAERRL